jgi:hypothetical protein
LQELIAPTEVMFFTADWKFIGFRTSLSSRIAQITGIEQEILSGGNIDKLHAFSVAQKFSWASKRKTTRGEDRAYSLIGIFGVSMSMIYGEGNSPPFSDCQKRSSECMPTTASSHRKSNQGTSVKSFSSENRE